MFSIDSIQLGAVDLRPKATPINVVEGLKPSAAVLETGNKRLMVVIGLIGNNAFTIFCCTNLLTLEQCRRLQEW